MRPQRVTTAPQTLTDSELARRVAAGDKEAFRALIRKYNQTLYRTARAILRDEAEAEDAVQEAYLVAFRSMAGYRGDAKLSTWLVRIVANEAIARYRKRMRRAEVIPLDASSDLPPGFGGGSGDGPPPTDPGEPEHEAVRAETRRMLESKIDQLPEDFRAVFMLRAVEEMSVEETAFALGIPQATVRSRYFRARSALRESISRDFDVAVEKAFGFAGDRCDRMLANVLARLEELPPANPENSEGETS
jgi:RNA polymerase sigma-70 factor, ECF subfamily